MSDNNDSNRDERRSRTEAGLIGSVLIDPTLLTNPTVQTVINRSEWWSAHRGINRAIRQQVAKGRPLDVLLLRNQLVENGDSGEVTLLGKAIQTTPNAAHGVFYAHELREIGKHTDIERALVQFAADVKRGREPSATIEAMVERLAMLSDEGDVVERPLPEMLTAAELDSGDFAVDYLCDGVLAKLQPAIVGAPSKGCKTSTTCDLSLSLATGSDFLGRFFCRRSNVLFYSGESGLGTLQETCRRICRSKGFDLGEVNGFTLSTWVPRFNNDVDLDSVRRMIEKTQADVVIVDPLYLALDGDGAENLFKQGVQLRRVAVLALEMGCTPILVHHTKRSTGADLHAMPELSWLAWSGFAEFARQWILLNRRETYEPGSGIHRLWLTLGGSAGHSGAWGLDIDEGKAGRIGGRLWEVTLQHAGEIQRHDRDARLLASANRKDEQRRLKEQREDEAAQAKFRELGTLTQSKLAAAMCVSGSVAKATCQRLLERGVIVPVEVQTNGGRFPGYCLADSGSDKVGQGQTSDDCKPCRTGSDNRGYISPVSSDPTLTVIGGEETGGRQSDLEFAPVDEDRPSAGQEWAYR